jgi:hypothetical protein
MRRLFAALVLAGTMSLGALIPGASAQVINPPGFGPFNPPGFGATGFCNPPGFGIGNPIGTGGLGGVGVTGQISAQAFPNQNLTQVTALGTGLGLCNPSVFGLGSLINPPGFGPGNPIGTGGLGCAGVGGQFGLPGGAINPPGFGFGNPIGTGGLGGIGITGGLGVGGQGQISAQAFGPTGTVANNLGC